MGTAFGKTDLFSVDLTFVVILSLVVWFRNGVRSRKTVTIYGVINFGAINLLLQKMEQFYGSIIWHHLMVAPFNGAILWHVCTGLKHVI